MVDLDIYQEIIQKVWKKNAIEDEIVYYLWDRISDQYIDHHTDSEKMYHEKLLDRLNSIWQYEQIETLSSEQSFLYGGIWGCLSILSLIRKKRKQKQECHALAHKYNLDSSYLFLQSIYDLPGLQNKKLAEICGVTPARISQIAVEASKEGLISTMVLGKEKYYFIKEMGEDVYNLIQRQKKYLKHIANEDENDYKILFFSNKEDNFASKVSNVQPILNYLSEQHDLAAIGIAYQKKSEDFTIEETYMQLNNERSFVLCQQEMNNLYTNYTNFCNVQKGPDMIKLQKYMI